MEMKEQDYKTLIELVGREKENIHKEAFHNQELRAKEIELDFIKIKLDIQLNRIRE